MGMRPSLKTGLGARLGVSPCRVASLTLSLPVSSRVKLGLPTALTFLVAPSFQFFPESLA